MNLETEKDYERRVKEAAARAMRYRRAFNRLWIRRTTRWIRRLIAMLAIAREHSRIAGRHGHAHR